MALHATNDVVRASVDQTRHDFLSGHLANAIGLLELQHEGALVVRAPLGDRSVVDPIELWCSPVPAPSTDTRADPASARRAAGPARGRVGRAGGPLWCGPNLGAGAFRRRKAQARCSLSAERHSLLSSSQVAIAPYCAPLSAQPRPAAGRATEWPGPPSDRPPQSASVEEVSRLA